MVLMGLHLWADTYMLDDLMVESAPMSTGTQSLSEASAVNQGYSSIQQRLDHEVSFTTVRDGKGEQAISFRGMDHRTTDYYEDGIPLYRTVNGFVDTRYLMHRGELLVNKGSGTGVTGVSAMGGEVNLITRKPSDSDSVEASIQSVASQNDQFYQAQAGLKYDGFYVTAMADYYHRSSYSLSDRFDHTAVQSSGQRVNSDKRQKQVALKAGYLFSDALELAAKVSVMRSHYGMPPNVYTDISAPVWDAYSRIDRKDLDSFYLYGDYHQADVEVSLRLYRDSYADIWNIFTDEQYTGYLFPPMTYDDSRLGAIVRTGLETADLAHDLFLQVEENEHIARTQGTPAAPRFQNRLYKASYTIAPVQREAEWYWEGAVGYTLLRQGDIEQVAVASIDDKHAVEGLAKLEYRQKRFDAYASVSRKSRMPSMNEMFPFFGFNVANPALKPERSMQYEVGYEYYFDLATLSTTLYHYAIKDLIVEEASQSVNREKARHDGAEFMLESESLNNHLIHFSYAYARSRDNTGKRLEGIPEHQIALSDTIHLPKSWEGSASYRYVGSRYTQNSADYANDLHGMAAYHLFDLQVSTKPARGLTLRAGVRNLLDEAYEWRYGYPAEGRNIYAALEWKLH